MLNGFFKNCRPTGDSFFIGKNEILQLVPKGFFIKKLLINFHLDKCGM